MVLHIRHLLLVAGFVGSAGLAGAAESPRFSGRSLDDIPAGELRRGLEALPPGIRKQSLSVLAGRSKVDIDSLRVSHSGGLFYVCSRSPETSSTVTSASVSSAPRQVRAAAPTPPVLHSKPGLTTIIFLDFNGGVVSGTDWNIGAQTDSVPAAPSFDCLPFDRDGDTTTFSTAEQAFITEVWSRVAEDYAPFNVDVTTESPTLPFSTRVAWAMITPDRDAGALKCPHFNAGGIAFVNVFGTSSYANFSPAWVWAGDTTVPANRIPASHVAEAASHEVGHNLGLSHDGRPADPDPYGIGGYAIGFPAVSGVAPSWGPIMGAPYGRDLTLWSKGEYDGATNSEDDLSKITTKLGLRPDIHGHSIATASTLTISAGGSFAQTGIIARTDEADFFVVTWPSTANFEAHAEPFRAATNTAGGDLDIRLELVNADGTALAPPLSADDPDALGASLVRTSLPAGNYRLVVRPAGKGTPSATSNPNGYTSYGVLGAYTLTGVPGPSLAIVDASAASVGSVQIGTSATRTITVINAGTSGSLTLTSFSSLIAPFTLSNVPSPLPTLAPGQSVSCQVQFSPTAAGLVSDSFMVGSDVGGAVTVTVSGTGVVPPPPAPAPAPAATSSDSGGGGGCGAGSGLAVILALLTLRIIGQRLARPTR